MPCKVFGFVLLSALLIFPAAAAPVSSSRVQITLDTSEADLVLTILAHRAAGKSIGDSEWQALFGTEPYERLKARQKEIARRFNDPSVALNDDDFRKFVMSDELLAGAPELRSTLERWKHADLNAAGEAVLNYLPQSAVIHAKVFPVIKEGRNSFVWEPSTNPAIFLYLDPDVPAGKFANTVAHECHHIGLASAQADYEKRIESLPERAHAVAEWTGAFGEGLAMLAAAGGPDIDPHQHSSPEEHARWEHDMGNFNADLQSVNGFFLDILAGKFPNNDAITEKGSSFFGVQGPWYTVGYKMAVMVEKRFGRDALIRTMLDPRRLLVLYNQAATEHNATAADKLPLWSDEILREINAKS